jgi:biopolymer transport protein TolR
MPALHGRGSGRRPRRSLNEINMVPFIDVMLVLLIIFMVSAPMLTTGLVDLPTVGKSRQQPEHVIEVIVESDETLRLRLDGGEPRRLGMRELATQVKAAQAGQTQTPVVISADRQVKYEAVVKAMDTLQRAGISRVGLSVRSAAQSQP